MKNVAVKTYSLLALLAVLWSMPALAQWVVVQSNTPDFREGQMLQDNQTLSLEPAVVLRLVSADGELRTLQGPFHGELGGASTALASTTMNKLSQLLAKPPKRVVGASRSLFDSHDAEMMQPDNPWAIEISAAQHYCFSSLQPITLWRQSSGEAETLTMQLMGADQRHVVKLPAGADSVALPPALSIRDGDRLALSTATGSQQILFHQLPDKLDNDVLASLWMIENSCDIQGLALLRRALAQ